MTPPRRIIFNDLDWRWWHLCGRPSPERCVPSAFRL